MYKSVQIVALEATASPFNLTLINSPIIDAKIIHLIVTFML